VTEHSENGVDVMQHGEDLVEPTEHGKDEAEPTQFGLDSMDMTEHSQDPADPTHHGDDVDPTEHSKDAAERIRDSDEPFKYTKDTVDPTGYSEDPTVAIQHSGDTVEPTLECGVNEAEMCAKVGLAHEPVGSTQLDHTSETGGDDLAEPCSAEIAVVEDADTERLDVTRNDGSTPGESVEFDDTALADIDDAKQQAIAAEQATSQDVDVPMQLDQGQQLGVTKEHCSTDRESSLGDDREHARWRHQRESSDYRDNRYDDSRYRSSYGDDDRTYYRGYDERDYYRDDRHRYRDDREERKHSSHH